MELIINIDFTKACVDGKEDLVAVKRFCKEQFNKCLSDISPYIEVSEWREGEIESLYKLIDDAKNLSDIKDATLNINSILGLKWLILDCLINPNENKQL